MAMASSPPQTGPSFLSSADRGLDSICFNVSALLEFARHGSWRSVLDAVAHARKLSLPHLPHEQLIYNAFLLFSLFKLRRYGEAAAELDALSDLDRPQYRFDSFPEIYPGRSGSMIPFVLRWIHAELPHRMGQASVTMERLYSLYDRCREHVLRLESLSAPFKPESHDSSPELPSQQCVPTESNTAQTGNSVDLEADRKEQAISVQATDSNIEFGTEKAQEVDIVKGIDSDSNREVVAEERDNEFGDFVSEMRSSLNDVDKSTRQEQDDNLKRWQQRQEFVISCIISHHLNQKDFILVLKWFKQLLLNHPSDPSLYSKLGYVLMQLGDLNGASRVFEEVERIVGETKNDPSSSYLKCLIYRNRGMKLVSQKKYLEAIKEFEAALAIDPLDVVSANNKALCSMYSRDLIGSTKVLESILDKAPSLALNESLVLNLCSMYELASVHNHQTKKNLSDWIQKVAPSDFDISCTRL